MVQNELHIRGSIFSTIAKMLVYFAVLLFFFSLYTSNPPPRYSTKNSVTLTWSQAN